MTKPPYDQSQASFADGDPVPRPPKTDLDPDPDIFFIFLGQLAFCYNPTGYCEIGINNKAGRHELSIIVYESVNGGTPRRIHWYPDDNQPDTPRDIRFDVNNPKESGVFFYQPDGLLPRRDLRNALDFQWIADLEGEDFYNVKLTKKANNLQPRLRVGNGTFYSVKTKAEFDLYDSRGLRHLGSVGRIIAVNISLNPGGYATFTIDGQVWRLDKKADTRYMILFSYDCDGRRCEWNPAGLSKYERNDFYLYFKTFQLDGNQEEVELIKSPPPRASSARASDFIDFGIFKILTNDEAPCGANGYFGRSTSLD
jgi:hypothetical protein